MVRAPNRRFSESTNFVTTQDNLQINESEENRNLVRYRGHHKFEIKATGDEAKSYDFLSARPPGKRTNVIESIGHLVKSCLGGGVMAIHESYKQCGLWTSVVLTILLGMFVSYCMLILAQSAQKIYGRVQVPAMSYPDLAQAALETGPFTSLRKYSKCFRYAVDFTICADLFGSCCVYQIMISRTIKQLVEGTDEISPEGNPPLRVYIACLLIPCILICMITTLKYLAPFSIVADVFIVTCAGATIYYAVKTATMSPVDFPVFKTVPGLFEFMGVCVFSMEGVGVTLAIENSMAEPKKIPIVLAGGMSIVISIVLTVGFFGYWGFGEKSKSPVTLNFPLEPFPIVLKVLMALMIYVTFALNFWVPFDLVWFYIRQRYDASKYWFWERVYRAMFVTVITIIAVIFPAVTKFIGLNRRFSESTNFVTTQDNLQINESEENRNLVRYRGHHKFEIKATGDEAKSYDFLSARPPGKRTNVIESIGHLVKSCLGGGVMAIHESYKQCGLWTSVVLTILLGMFVSYCMLILAQSAQKIYGRVQVPAMSYPDLAQAALETGPFTSLRKYSKCFRYAVDFTICADLFGSCCVYQIMISRTIKQLVEGTDEISPEGNPPLRVYIACLLIPCILICMITTLKYLAPFSIVADVFIVTCAGATIYYAVKTATMSPVDFPVFKTVPGLFEFMGVCVFSMEGVGVTLAIENSMAEPKKIPIVLAGGMSIVISIVLTVGFFGYWGFGEKSKSPVTLNFPLEPFPIVLKVLMALMIYVTFALNFWVPFDLVWFYIRQRYDASKYWFWERVYRAMFVTVITIIAVIFPAVTKFIGLLGSFCLSNMGFIYPAFIELCLDWNDPGPGILMWRLWKFIFILIFGTILCIVGTYSNAKELISEVF